MGRHSLTEEPDEIAESPAEVAQPRRPEPVAIAAAAQAVLAAAVTIGWVTLDDQAIAIIGTAVAAVISVVFTWFARSRVTPVSDPKL